MASDVLEGMDSVETPVVETQGAMPPAEASGHRWAVILAGGDGTSLQSLTLKIAGDCRPKQFCPFIGGETLLSQTRARIESLFNADRQLFVVTRAHETYYREELRNVEDARIIAQPLNRGTGIAIALSLLHILKRDTDAVVVFVPCDHYYSDAEACGRAIKSAISSAEQYPDSLVLVGAKAHYPEVEYGWIELGASISQAGNPLLRVNRFWEKPSLPQAQALLRRGCLWNTFVTVGHVGTFLDLLCSEAPEVVPCLDKALAEDKLETAYRLLPAVDFSHHILALQPHRLLAVSDTTSGWADLGSPTRVLAILARDKIQPSWLNTAPQHSPGRSQNRDG
jgi:mannose-1-phosphate guanylyltransferase